MCLACLRAHMPACHCALCAYMPLCLVCLCAHVPMGLHCLRAHAPMCLAYLCAHMPTCPVCICTHVLMYFLCSHAQVPTHLEWLCATRVNMICVLMYSHVVVACKLMWSFTNMSWVPCLTQLMWPCDHLPTCFVSSVSHFDATFFSFTAIVVEVVDTW